MTKVYCWIGKILCGVAGAIIGFLFGGCTATVLGAGVGFLAGQLLEKTLVNFSFNEQ